MYKANSRRGKGCPLCGKPVSTDHAPFCGQGCRNRDLLRWLDNSYRVAGPPADENVKEFDADGLDSEGEPPL